MKILKSSEKKKILEKLNNQFGISSLPYLLLRFGKEKIRIYSGNLSTEELNELDKNLKIENIGLYAFQELENTYRLSFDSVTLFKDQITKNILELNDKQAKEWLKGEELIQNIEPGLKVIKHDNEFVGCGKATGEKITNFVPKVRRIKD